MTYYDVGEHLDIPAREIGALIRVSVQTLNYLIKDKRLSMDRDAQGVLLTLQLADAKLSSLESDLQQLYTVVRCG